uniref:Uncharacterized protein n=1 Tax=Amphimedon queenslandica TaxID=400682 RepID=A0A1X7SWR9_AMPQE
MMAVVSLLLKEFIINKCVKEIVQYFFACAEG